jgi:hypothetical protein
MKKPKFFYLVEPIDIDGDKNNDGFLVSQYKLTRDNHKIFTKNKYITFKDFETYVNEFKHKSLLKFKGGSFHQYHQQPMMYHNKQMPNQPPYVIMDHKGYNNYMNYNGYQGYPPQVIVKDHHGSNFGSNFMNGLGGGIGAGIGFGFADGLMEGIFGF